MYRGYNTTSWAGAWLTVRSRVSLDELRIVDVLGNCESAGIGTFFGEGGFLRPVRFGSLFALD